MHRSSTISSILIGAVVGVAGPLGQSARSADFHVENKVYRADEKEPFSETTTLFRAGLVYDFVTKDGQVEEATVFDRTRGRFVLLDAKRRVKAEISTTEVQAFGRHIREKAASQTDPLWKFMANPKFTKETSAEDTLELSSDWLTYRVKTTQARSTEAAAQYGEFAHWYCATECHAESGDIAAVRTPRGQ